MIDKERVKSYDPTKFDQLFDEFDSDSNNFLSKGEMAQFIKKFFKRETKWYYYIELKKYT